MTLLADYQTRVSTQLRTNWSNPGQSSATIPNTALETLAAADVTGRFQAATAVVYDSTNPIHVDVAIMAVALKLQQWTSQVLPNVYEDYVEAFTKAGAVLGHDRLTPFTDSTKIRTPDPANAKVAADWTTFVGYVPALPTPSATVDASGLNT